MDLGGNITFTTATSYDGPRNENNGEQQAILITFDAKGRLPTHKQI